jgi:hypothetical protein
MIAHENAMQIAQKTINDLAGDSKIDISIIQTIISDKGWAFFYNSKEYIEKGDKMARLLGNIPFAVDKLDGTVYFIWGGYLIGDIDSPEFWNNAIKRERKNS